MSDNTQTRYFRVTTDENRGGEYKSRTFVAQATREKPAEDGDFFGYAKYLYHQTVRGVLGYTDCEKYDGKHVLHKNGNVMDISSIDEISKMEYLDAKNVGVKELEKQQ